MFPAVSGSSLSGQSLSLPPRGSSPSGQSLPPYSLVSLILVSMRGLGMVSVCVPSLAGHTLKIDTSIKISSKYGPRD